MLSSLETFNLVLTVAAGASISLCAVYLVRLARRRRDVTAFKHLLWQWYTQGFECNLPSWLCTLESGWKALRA